MDFATFLIQTLNSLQYGLLLFLVASGLTLVFGIMGIINLAHGSFYMIGAYLAFALSSLTGNLMLAIVLGIPLAFGFGALLEKLLFVHLYKRDHLQQVLLTYGLILIFEELRSLTVGDDVHGVAIPDLFSASIALSDNLIQHVVGRGLLGKLSARFGEGTVNGILTARIGLAARDVCRPIPQETSAKDTLGSLMKELVSSAPQEKEG